MVTFEDNVNVLDTMILTSNIQSDVSVSNASAAWGDYAIRMTGGDPINSGITPDLDSNNFWSNNIAFASFAKFCVDATGWAGAGMYFELRQTMSKVYSIQFGQPIPAASSLRVVVNGTQIGGVYNPATETSDPFVTEAVDLNAYAGTQFEVVFETRMGFSEAADPMSGFPFNSEGDNAYIDNVRFSQYGVSVEEHEIIENMGLYPNPNNGTFSMEFNSANNQEVKLEIYNVLGSIVLSENKLMSEGLNKIDIDISNQTKGIYFVKLTTNSNSHIARVVKN